jgi:hypothetical protein
MSVNDTNVHTHVLSFELFIGPVPEGMEVCHSCDVKRCNNPRHLFAGTHLTNIRDMWSKGRGKKPPRLTGASHPQAVLNDVQVREIRYQRLQGVP